MSTQRALVVAASLLTGAVVAVSGGIGFVGLVVPHVARTLVGSDHRRMLPVAVLGGAVFLVSADLVTRSGPRRCRSGSSRHWSAHRSSCG